MKSLILAAAFCAASPLAMAQGTTDKPLSAVPPATQHDQQSSSPPSSQSSGTVVPGPGYAHGTGNVGDSSETKGMLGSRGAGASATMQSGHTSNR